MEDKTMLSKHKYIYGVKKNNLGEVIVERWPVIYTNKSFVYYKTPSADALKISKTKAVRRVCSILDVANINPYFYEMFWDVPTDVRKKLPYYAKYIKLEEKRKECNTKKANINSMKATIEHEEKAYVLAQIELSELEEEIDKLKGKGDLEGESL